MLIILEGGDGSGKTTLHKKLIKAGAKSISILRHDNLAMYKYMECLHQPERYFVMDRSFITDLVYRINDGEKRDVMNLMDMATILRHINLIIIHCETDTSFEDGMKRGEDNITDKTEAETIKSIYRLVMKMLTIFADTKVLHYDWHLDDDNEVIRFINRKSDYKNKLKEI